jgi:hypothetical protein
MEEEVEDAAVDRDVVLLGSIAHVEGNFYGFSGLQHIHAPRTSEDSTAKD